MRPRNDTESHGIGEGMIGGLHAGVLPRRTPRARRRREKVVMGKRMMTKDVVIGFVRRR